jgi:hypothetical protein
MTSLTLPLLLVRVIYPLIAVFDTRISSTGPIIYRICLSVVMELFMVISLCIAGVWTRNIRTNSLREARSKKTVDLEPTCSGEV